MKINLSTRAKHGTLIREYVVFLYGVLCDPFFFFCSFFLSEANIFTVSFAFVLVLDLRGKLFSCAYFTMLNIQVVDVCKNIL